MENLSHSRQPNMLSKRSCNGNTNKSIYHDVFGGPPKFGASTLSPRVDDYNEIFGGFRTSRASSIPVLDLPLDDEAAEVFFDVRSSGFDYGEVFGGFNGHDFAAVSYEELLMMEQSNGYGDSSDEAWTPAEAENLSEVSDHSAKDHCLSNRDSFKSLDGGMEFNISYNKAGQRTNEDLPNGITHITQLHDLSEYTYVVDKTASLSNTDSKYEHLLESDDHFGIGYSGEMMRERHLSKVMSLPANGITDGLLFGNDFKPHKEFVRNGSLPNEMFVTVSDVSLRTQPSHLPPPFRPPPALDAKKEGCVEANPNCKSVSSEEIAGDNSPPYFDVEVDASSSAAAIKEAMEKAQAKLKSAKESMERKKEGFQTRTKSGSKNDRKDKEEKVTKIVNGPGSRKDERVQDISHREENGMEFSILEERQKVQITSQLISDSLEGKKNLYVGEKSAEENHGRKSLSSQGSDTIDGAGEWKEATQFFELVTNKSGKAFDQENNENILVHDSDFHEHGKKEKKATVEALQRLQENARKVKVVRADQELKEHGKKSEVSKETFKRDKSSVRSQVANRQKGLQKKLQLPQDVSRQEGNEKKFSIDLKPLETEEQARADELQIHENYAEVQQKEHKFAARQTSHKEKGSRPKEDTGSMQDVKKFTCEKEDGERRQRRAFELEENEKKLNITLEQRENERRLKKALGQEEKQKMIKAVSEKEENEMLSGSYETGENEKRLRETLEWEENGRRLKEALEMEQNERRMKEMHEREERLRRKSKAAEQEVNKKKQRESHEREENEKRQREAREREENEKRLKEALEKEENEKKQREFREREENEKRQREAREREENEKRLKEALEKEENERRLKETLEKEERQRRQREASEQEENAKREREAHEREENEKRLKEALEKEENERRLKVDFEREENEKRLKEAHETEENEKKQREAREKRCKEAFERDEIVQGIKEAHVREVGKRPEVVCKPQENCMTSREAQEDDHEPEEIGDASQMACKREVTETKPMETTESGKQKGINKMGEGHSVSNQSCKLDDDKNPGATQLTGMQGGSEKLEAAKEIDHEETCKRFTVHRNDEKDVASGIPQWNLEHEKSRFVMENVENVAGTEQKTIGNIRDTFRADSDVGNEGKKFAHERSERGKNIEQSQSSLNQEKNKDDFRSARAVKESVEMGRKMEGAQPVVLEVKGSTHRTSQQVNASQSSERKMKNSYENLSSVDREAERMKRERDLEMERLRKIEEEREREREREKDRMAVDRAILETREKVYAEARERAERAAVERVTAEARQRALNEARERLEKACAEAREKSFPDKASTEARLKAERAAVERATAEARERAFEKAMAERATFETRERVERSVSDKFSASSRNVGMRPSFSSSDLQDIQSQGTGSFSGSRYRYSSVYGERFEGVEGESAQRCKARLERHQRTAERAAKALAEKNMRDLLAQREQAERNRVAETLDADVKRWSSGKEGNLRALLSTLQYILGPDSGWQPIPLTEVITSAAVKKAYRKATLCVHPDKLQQRGATIQQKYICEKVFDLLKEAWNKFNSEER